jgi:signal transduction histidine kinase
VNGFISSKLGRRFLWTFLLVMLPIGAVGWWGMREASAAIQLQTHAELRAASDGAEAQLREFLLSVKQTTEALAEEDGIRKLARGQEKATVVSEVFARLRRRIPEAQELFYLNASGRVAAASRSELAGKDFAKSRLFTRGLKSFYAGDVLRDEEGVPRWRMSAPLKESGQTVGVVAIGIDPKTLSSLTAGQRVLAEGADTQSFRIGQTGETYLVNREGFLITESRFVRNGILKVKMDTEPIRAWQEHDEELIADYRDYRGVPVSGASAIVNEPDWLLLTEINFSQAFVPIAHLRNAMIALALGAAVAAVLVVASFARKIVQPVKALSEADQALARGDEKAAIVAENWLPDNEIGQLVLQRNRRIRELLERQRELAREQQARAEVSAELQRISYSMVHDMRAPLRAVIGFGNLLAEELGERLSQTEKSYIDRMRYACERMDRLICDLLRYTSLLHLDLPLSAVNVPELVESLLETHPGLREKRADIELQKNMPLVIGNREALGECLTALLDNALRYSRPGVPVKVEVSAETAGDRVRIIVADNGLGMPETLRAKVFDIFQRGTSAHEGTGIGLAVVRLAVERMGGRAGVESEEGTGSRFWIELKAAG